MKHFCVSVLQTDKNGNQLKKIFYLPTILIYILFTPIVKADNFDSLVTKGINQIYNIKFEEAEETFRKLMADFPEHPSGRFFLAMIDWWRILLDIDIESYDEIFFLKLEDVIYQCDEILKKEPNNFDALFFKGGAIGFRGRLRSLRDSWIKAADDGREALPLVQRAYRIDSTRADIQLGFGIYNYYAGVIPERYPLIKPLMIFFPSGNKIKGIEQLNDVANNGQYAKHEARYFLMTLYFDYENNPYQAEQYAQLLVNDFPDNPTFQRWWGRIAVRRGNTNLSDEIFRNALEKSREGLPGYNKRLEREAAYYIGLNHFNRNQQDSAMIFLKLCEEISREIDGKTESGFLINAILYLGNIYDTMGEREKAVDNYKQLLSMREFGQSKILARRYLEHPFHKN